MLRAGRKTLSNTYTWSTAVGNLEKHLNLISWLSSYYKGNLYQAVEKVLSPSPFLLIPGQRVDLNSIIGDKQRALMPANGCLVALGHQPTTDKK